jgi:hypothetical protein
MKYVPVYSKRALESLIRISEGVGGGSGKPVWAMIRAITEAPTDPYDSSKRLTYRFERQSSLFWCTCVEMRVKVEYYIDVPDDELSPWTIYFRGVEEI